MIKLIFYLIITFNLLIAIPCALNAQVTPYGLRISKVQSEIINELQEYDSAIFADISSFWFNDDRKIQGYGYKGTNSFQIEITFKVDTSYSYGLTVKKIKSKKSKNLKLFNLDSIQNISKDSLTLKTRGKVYRSTSDANEWTLLIYNKSEITLLQSYNPEYFQSTVPTKERELFMKIVRSLNKSKKIKHSRRR
jgi:hypothetical protein